MEGDTGVLVTESRGLYSQKLSYATNRNNNCLEQISEDEGRGNTSITRSFNNIRLIIRQIFLPYGYPDSVSDDYMEYQIYDTIQAFCSSLTGALATEAVMKGVGVGDETATPLAAALTWLLKSGSGMIGQIVFTWYQGTNLDSDCKKWRFFADVVNDSATFIDLLSPAFSPGVRLPVFCISSVARSLVGVAGGATRAAITQHQARCNNMADVSAKDGSQETLVNLIALIASLIILPAVSGNYALVWTLYIIFTASHLLANYNALKSLHFESLNNSRLLHNLREFLRNGTVLTVRAVNDLESVFLGLDIREEEVSGSGYKIQLGVSIGDALRHTGSSARKSFELPLLQAAIKASESRSKNFLIVPDSETRTNSVILHENIPPWEVIEAYCRSVFLTHFTGTVGADYAFALSDELWWKFEAALVNAGYATDRALLKICDWRACWRKKL